MRALAQGVGSRRPLLLCLGTGVRFPHLHNVAPLVFRVLSGPAAREARASLRSAPRLEARPCPPDPPAPSTPVGPGVLTCGSARRLEARPGPAAAHRHRGRSLLRPPHQCGLVCWRVVWCVVSTPGRVPRLDVFPLLSFACNSPATLSNREFTTLELQRFQTLLKLHPIELHAKFGGGGVVAAQGSQPGPTARGCRSQAMSARWTGGLKPLSPLLACVCAGLKPPSPLRVRNGRFWCIFRVQR